MKLTQLTAKPQLIQIILDKPELVETYGEPLEFWIWDRQPIDQFIRMATASSDNYGEMIRLVNDMILDEAGKPVVKQGEVLPTDVMTAAIAAVVERLGK